MWHPLLVEERRIPDRGGDHELIPDPAASPWPRPVEYVFVGWTLSIIFGPLMIVFWAISDNRWSLSALGWVGGVLIALALWVSVMTEWTARKSGISRRQVSAAVRRAFPQRFTI